MYVVYKIYGFTALTYSCVTLTPHIINMILERARGHQCYSASDGLCHTSSHMMNVAIEPRPFGTELNEQNLNREHRQCHGIFRYRRSSFSAG